VAGQEWKLVHHGEQVEATLGECGPSDGVESRSTGGSVNGKQVHLSLQAQRKLPGRSAQVQASPAGSAAGP